MKVAKTTYPKAWRGENVFEELGVAVCCWLEEWESSLAQTKESSNHVEELELSPLDISELPKVLN